jgi:hypothetical protein
MDDRVYRVSLGAGQWLTAIPGSPRVLDRGFLPGNTCNVNRELIRQQLVGQRPRIIRTSDGKEFSVPHPEFVLVGRHNLVIEDSRGLLEIIDPLHVVSIRPGARRQAPKAAA